MQTAANTSDPARVTDMRPAPLGDACVTEALKIIAQDGFDKLSLREVARRLGVSHQAPYRHFESRDHLIVEVLRRCFQKLADAIASRDRSADPVTDLRAMGAAYLRFALENPVEYELMIVRRWPEVDVGKQMIEDSCLAFEDLRAGLTRLRTSQGRPSDRDSIDRDAIFVMSAMDGLAAILRNRSMEHLMIAEDVRRDVPAHIMMMIEAALSAPV